MSRVGAKKARKKKKAKKVASVGLDPTTFGCAHQFTGERYEPNTLSDCVTKLLCDHVKILIAYIFYSSKHDAV